MLIGLIVALNPIHLFANSLEQRCTMKPVSDPLVAGRAWSVTFPDQRTITVVGHAHGARQIRELYELASNCELNRNQVNHGRFCTPEGKLISDANFKELIIKIKSENQIVVDHFNEKYTDNYYKNLRELFDLKESDFVLPKHFEISANKSSVIDHADQDYQYLKKIIPMQNGKHYFIGHEATESITRADFPKYQYAINSAKKEFAIRSSPISLDMNYQDFERIIRSSSMGNIWFFHNHSKNYPNIRFIGTELEEIANNQNYNPIKELSQSFEAINNQIDSIPEVKKVSELNLPSDQKRKLLPHDIRLYIYLIQVAEFESGLLKNFRDTNDLLFIIEKIQSVRPKSLETETNEFINKLTRRVNFNSIRDFHSAKNMVAQKISGTHFVGMNHLANTVRYLSDFCRAEHSSNISSISEIGSSRTKIPQIDLFSRVSNASPKSDHQGGTQ